MNKIQFLIAKFICKWGDFAGLGNDEDFLELKRLIKDYEDGISKRKKWSVIWNEKTISKGFGV